MSDPRHALLTYAVSHLIASLEKGEQGLAQDMREKGLSTDPREIQGQILWDLVLTEKEPNQ